MARQVITQVEIAGNTLPTFSKLLIEQVVHWHHEFEVRLPVDIMLHTMGKYSSDKTLDVKFHDCKEIIGQEIKIFFESKFDLSDSENYFKGLVTEISFSRKYASSVDLVVKGKSPTVMMDDGEQCRSFEEKSPKDVAKEIINEYDASVYKHEYDESFTKTLDYIVQYNESNFHFIHRLAAYYGEWYYYDGSVMRYGRPASENSIELHLGRELTSFDLGIKLIPLKFENVYYDILKNEAYNESSKSLGNEGTLDSFSKFAYEESNSFYSKEPITNKNRRIVDKNKKMFEDAIEADKSSRFDDLVIFSGHSDHCGLKLGKEIAVSSTKIGIDSEEETYGKYRLTHIWHMIDNKGNYHNRFEAIPAKLEFPPPNEFVKEPFSEAQCAVVKDNSDPEKMGRVRVQFYWQKGSEKTPWLRLLATASGKARGFYFVPEKEEQVMIGFEKGHPERPYVLGSIYNGEEKFSGLYDGGNLLKGIRTISGNEIQIHDKSGKEEIKIFNKDEKNVISLCMDGAEGGGEKILIKSDKEVYVQAENIRVRADKNIDIKAGKQLTMGCEKLLVYSTSSSNHFAGGSHTTASVGSLNIMSASKSNIISKYCNIVAGLSGAGGVLASVKSKLLKLDAKKIMIDALIASLSNDGLESVIKSAIRLFKWSKIPDGGININGQDDVTIVSKKDISIGSEKDTKIITKENLKVETDKETHFTAKEHYTVETKKELILDSEEDFKMRTSKKMVQHAKETFDVSSSKSISIKADENIIVHAEKELELDAEGDAQLISAKKMVVSSGMDLTLDGGKNVKMKGGMDIKIDAMKNCEVVGTMSTVKGIKVNVDASGIAIIKGSMVMIN